jgi:UDPglucose 6-dehydrogenase
MRIAVFGLWHLGSVTSACLTGAGHRTIGLDLDEAVVTELQRGRAPLHEPGLDALVAEGIASGTLSFTTDPDRALADADVLWVAFDTPVDDQDEADLEFVRSRLDAIRGAVRPGTTVLLSSQVPVGFTAALERSWAGKGCRFAYSPENLRLGKAVEVFRHPERVVAGVRGSDDRALLSALFAPFCERIEWMSVESAEMTKHALNAFLAASVTFINELARVCEAVGADAKEVERGLKSEGRIGPRAYLAPGAAFAGGTLARDVRFLIELGHRHGLPTPVLDGILASNNVHKEWAYEHVCRFVRGIPEPVVAVLGLTYKPGTSTLRRSAAIEICRKLHARGIRVQAHDPVVRILPAELQPILQTFETPAEALCGADAAIVGTEWPELRTLRAVDFATRMRRPCVLDPSHFLAATLLDDPRVAYVCTGRPPAPVARAAA